MSTRDDAEPDARSLTVLDAPNAALIAETTGGTRPVVPSHREML